jgi:hypothetical protein
MGDSIEVRLLAGRERAISRADPPWSKFRDLPPSAAVTGEQRCTPAAPIKLDHAKYVPKWA